MTDHERDDDQEPGIDEPATAGDEIKPEIKPEFEPEFEPEDVDQTASTAPATSVPRPTAGPAIAPSASEIAVHIDDRISAIFVLGAIAVFTAILLLGVVAGTGGLLTPLATPIPIVSPSASPSP